VWHAIVINIPTSVPTDNDDDDNDNDNNKRRYCRGPGSYYSWITLS